MALTDDLVSFWELGEASGARDDAHGANDLTDNNTVLSATGKVGDAADFESGNSEYLSRASNASLQMGDIDFTICAWVNIESLGASGMIVAKDDDAVSSRDYTLFLAADSKFSFYINGGGGFGVAESAGVSAATWYFVAAWHDATANTVNIQFNDGSVASASTSGAVPDTSSAEFRLGAREYAGFENYFDGLIDQVGIWKRKLSAAELTDLYNSGAGRSYASFATRRFLLARP